MPLLYDKTPDGVVALRLVKAEATGLSRTRWRQVRELAAAVLWCGACDGCRASVHRLMEVMNRNRLKPIVGSRAAFFRARTAAVKLGVIVDEPGYNGRGRTFSERAVDLKRVATLVEATRELARSQRKGGENLKAGKMRLTRNTPETHPLLYTNHLNPSILVDGFAQKHDERKNATTKVAGREKTPAPSVHRAAGDVDPVSVRRVATEIVQACRGCKSQRDWEFAVKVAILAADFGEHWLEDALGGLATCRPKNGWGYLTTCLSESTANLGRRFYRELARVTVPASLRYYGQQTRSARLCVAEEPT